MRIALLGAGGQLGSDLRSRLPGEVIPLVRPEIDLAVPESIDRALDATRPDVVVNAAAYNAVDRAESEPEVAFAVNALGPRQVARWCRRAGATIVHYSTDYVYSGAPPEGSLSGGASPEGLGTAARPGFREDACPDPQSVYAVTKLAGEQFVRAEAPRHFVLRTCGLYGARSSATKGNFVETMLTLGRARAATGEPLAVVDDHECTPTYTVDLAEATVRLLATSAWGLYHATNSGRTSWCRLAREIFRIANLPVTVNPISSADRPAAARRPSFSVLDGTRLAEALGWAMPRWEDALARFLRREQPS